jgi:hypothetical protein
MASSKFVYGCFLRVNSYDMIKLVGINRKTYILGMPVLLTTSSKACRVRIEEVFSGAVDF